MLVVYREQRAFERRKYRQFIVGPFDGGESRANGFDLFASMECLAADEQMRNPARLDGVDVRTRDVFAETRESTEQDGDVPGLQPHAPLVALGIAVPHPPPAVLFRQPC